MDITWLIFIVALLIGGAIDKYRNTKHMRELVRLVKENEAKKLAIVKRLEENGGSHD